MPGFDEILARLHRGLASGERMFATTSFQTHSVPLLHILSRACPELPVHYLDTGYLFPETLRFRDRLAAWLGIRFVAIRPDIPKSDQRDADGMLMYAWDPDRCCHVNKVQPLEAMLASHDLWISGVRADQSEARRRLEVEQPWAHGCRRYHPMLDWTPRDIHSYRKAHDLPAHPLEAEGYVSVGCQPCTRRPCSDDPRSGRWHGLGKTECGLNLRPIPSPTVGGEDAA
jgi:phosphoadenosine phosphosulfate reductase